MIIRYLQRHYDPDTVQGDAKWLTDLDDYNKKFTEPFGSTDKIWEKQYDFFSRFVYVHEQLRYS